MGDAKSSQTVYVPKTVALTLSPGSVKPPVSMVKISLSENQLPVIHLLVDPAHEQGQPPVPAMKPTLADIKKWLDKLQEIAANPDSRAQLDIELVSGTGEQGQTLKLSDWLVTAAGMTGVSATGQLGLEVEIQHPVGILDRAPANISNLLSVPLSWDSFSYKNPVDGLSKAYATWAAAERVPPTSIAGACGGVGTDGNAVLASTIKGLKESAQDIPKYLQWTTSWPGNAPGYIDFPFASSCLAAELPSLQYALTAYASQFGDPSIWSALVGLVAPEWQFTVVPTYWATQLQVMPYSPWAAPSITIYSDEIATLSFPGVDPATVGGVRMPLSPSEESIGYTLTGASDAHETQQLASEVVYLPPLAQSKGVNGRIIKFNPPSWLLSVAQASVAAAGASTEPGAHEGYDALDTTENIDAAAEAPSGAADGGLESAGKIMGALYGVAHQVFLSQFRSGVEASILTPLRIQAKGSKWPGGYVTPGCVLRVMSGPPGGALFDMYLVTVEHILDVANATASTVFTGRYCRPEQGFPGIIEPATYNPMYLRKRGMRG